MTSRVSSSKPTPILPPGQAEERPLFVIMVIMAFLASVTLIIALMGIRQSQAWQNDLASAATLQISAESAELQQAQIDLALGVLNDTPGVRSAEPLSEAENRALLNPWIGEAGLPDDIQVPALIRVTANFDRLDIGALNNNLQSQGITSKLDNHQRWSRNLTTSWQRLRIALIGLLAIMIAATMAISSFATQSVLKARQNIINVLGQVGATDKFIARLFVKRFLSLGFKASVTGAVLALMFITAFMLWQNLGTDENGQKLALELADILWLFGLSLLIGLIVAVTAGRSAIRTIQRQRPAA